MSAENPTTFDLLKQGKFLESLPDTLLLRIAGIASLVEPPTATVLFHEGVSHGFLYFVVDGRVALDMHIPHRGVTRILTVGPGEILAWSALLSDQQMTATATVIADSRLISLPATLLAQLCRTEHEIGYVVMHRMAVALSRRLLATRLQLLDLFADTQPL